MLGKESHKHNRQLIPRWHTFPVAKWLGILNSGARKEPITAIETEQFKKKQEEWANNKGWIYASDLVASAFALNEFNVSNVLEAAQYLIQNQASLPGLTVNLAKEYQRNSLGQLPSIPEIELPDAVRSYYPVISSLKQSLKIYPRNPVNWVDLAFFYTVLGQSKSAEHCMKIALQMAPENRFILLSASRYFLHRKMPEQALYYLRKSNFTRFDPWLISAEISVAESFGLKPKLITNGKRTLESESFSPFQLSELAGTLGTLEFNSGAYKKGKKLFKSALVDPTENALAQAVWHRPNLGGLGADLHHQYRMPIFEADARNYFNDQKFELALESTKHWLKYQPFSSSPAVFGTYIASVALCDFEEAVKIAKIGLISSPNDFILNNNLAFSLASLNRPADAEKTLKNIIIENLNDENKATILATLGAIEFKKGNVEGGKRLYIQSIEAFEKLKQPESVAQAKCFLAREEFKFDPESAINKLKEIQVSAEKLKVVEVVAAAKQVAKSLLSKGDD